MGKSNRKCQHPHSLANLREPWKPGQSGNNAGINQYSYRDEARESLSRWLREKDVTSGQTNVAAFISRICEEAARGNDWAAKMLWQESLKDNPHRFGHELGEAVDPEVLSRKLDQIARSEERRDPYALIAFHQAEVDRLRKEYPDAKPTDPDAGALWYFNRNGFWPKDSEEAQERYEKRQAENVVGASSVPATEECATNER